MELTPEVDSTFSAWYFPLSGNGPHAGASWCQVGDYGSHLSQAPVGIAKKPYSRARSRPVTDREAMYGLYNQAILTRVYYNFSKGFSMPASTEDHSRVSPSLPYGDRPKRTLFTWGAIFVALVLARIPYILTHHIQEDAYITFRSAFNLADHGSYSFNLGEHVSGVTSVLYGLMVALLRLIFRGSAIPAIQVVDTAMFILAGILLAKSILKERRQQMQFCVISSLVPIGLLISFNGMEIALQVLVVCWGLYLVRDGKPGWLVVAPAFLLPLVRPDAIALALLLALLVLTFDRLRGAATFLGSLAGVGTLLVFNHVVQGAFIPNTMRAKEIAYHPNHSVAAIVHRVVDIFILHSFMQPIESRFFIWVGVLSFPICCVCAVISIRRENGSPTGRVMLTMLAVGILIPVCFAAGGVLFPWYLWTSTWLLTAFPLYLLVVWFAGFNPARQWVAFTATAALICVMMGFQWLVSYNTGKKEFQYRAGIGRDIAALAHPGDSLLLEPAGYIPFFAGIHTDDFVGLVSDRVVAYRLRDGNDWFMDFLRTQQPTFLVQRTTILSHQTEDNAPISDTDWQWFTAHYRLVKGYHYRVSDFVRNPTLLRLTRAAFTSDYYLFERVS